MSATSVEVPAEMWETLSESYSAHLTMEHKGNKPLGVRAQTYKGFLYTSFAVMFGGWGASSKPWIQAYRLLPESMYDGETTLVYHDKEAIEEGRRERGDHTGLIVSVKGKKMVCAEPVEFVKDLPATKPLSLAEAQEFDTQQQVSGWRSLFYKGAQLEWLSLNSHPVVRYRKDDKSLAMLFWKRGKRIEEMSISDEIPLSVPGQVLVAASSVGASEQLMLF